MFGESSVRGCIEFKGEVSETLIFHYRDKEMPRIEPDNVMMPEVIPVCLSI